MKNIFILISICMLATPSFSEEISAHKSLRLEGMMPYLHKGHNVISNIYALDLHPSLLSQGTVSQAPWSDDYWPHVIGGIGYRYKDKKAPSLPANERLDGAKIDPNLGMKTVNYYQRNPAINLVNQGMLDQLSPAEKYDLLTGNKDSFPLSSVEMSNIKHTTKSFLGYRYQVKTGPWFGICEGWAGAAIYEKAPRKRIFVRDVNNKYTIPFNPSDIRALISKVYSVNKAGFLGKFPVSNVKKSIIPIASGHCRTDKYELGRTGKVLTKRCFDPNPATFHKTMLNFVGLLKRSFYMDVTFSSTIWNHPIKSYSFKYFSPKDHAKGIGYTTKFDEAMMSKESLWPLDPFRDYRSANVKNIVGVEMQVVYNTEMLTHNMDYVHARGEELKKGRFIYDLEIDKDGNIIGGEWYGNHRPDTVTAGPKDFKAITKYDRRMTKVSVEKNTLPEILDAAKPYALKSSLSGTPIGKVVRKLVQMSAQP